MTASRAAFAVLILSVAQSTACALAGASSTSPRGYAVGRGAESPLPGGDWASPFLGSATEIVVGERPSADGPPKIDGHDFGDAYMGLYFPKADALLAAWATARQVDIYSIGHTGPGGGLVSVAVLHGVPPNVDPQMPVDRYGPDFSLFRSLRGGVRVYKHRDGRASVFTLAASQTWVVATEPAATRFELALSNGAVDPPYLPMAPGSAEDMSAITSQLYQQNRAYIPNNDRAIGGGTVFFPSPPGAPLRLAGKTIYLDPLDAEGAADVLRQRLASGQPLDVESAKSTRVLGVRAVGRILFIDFEHTL